MKKYLKFFVIFLVLFLILFNVSNSKELYRIGSSDFEKYGFDYKKMYVMGFSKNSKFLLAVDKERNPKFIEEGKNTKILVIPVDKKSDSYVIYTPAYKIENYINLNDNEIVLLANDGTSIYKVNLKDKKVYELYKIQKGQEGVKMKGGFYTLDKEGNLYIMGAFFDKDQIFIDPNFYWIKSSFDSKQIFGEKVTNVSEVESKVGNVRMFYWADPYSAVFTKLVNNNPSELYYYDGKDLKLIDKKEYIFEIALSQNGKVIYPFSNSKDSIVNNLGIIDLKTSKKYVYNALFKKPFFYPFVNAKDTIVIAGFDMKNMKTDFYFTNESENMILHRFIKDYPMGSFKISDEDYYSLQTKDFVSVGKIEKVNGEKSIKPNE